MPRIEEANRELGHPEGSFDRMLERGCHAVLAKPLDEASFLAAAAAALASVA